MAGKLGSSVTFFLAGLLLAVVSLIGLPATAKEKLQKSRPAREPHAFLANKKRAPAYCNVLS